MFYIYHIYLWEKNPNSKFTKLEQNMWLFKNIWLKRFLLEIIAMAKCIISFKAATFYEMDILNIPFYKWDTGA